MTTVNRFLTAKIDNVLIIHYYLLILIAGSLMISCNSSRSLPPDYKGDQLHFGEGGGFTGEVTYFALLEDGRLFQKKTRDSSYAFLSTWDRNFTDQMFANYHQLGFDKINHYEPGNLYYFIAYHSKGQRKNLIGWGKPGFIPSPDLVAFYNLLYKSTKSKS